MYDIIYSSKLMQESLESITKAINSYTQGNKQEIQAIEKALQEVDKQLLAKLVDRSPSEILEYIEKVVDVKLKIEELKVKKGTSIINLIRGWAPILVPLLVGILPFIGVMVGLSIQDQNSKTSEKAEQVTYEKQLILNAFKDKTANQSLRELKVLFDAGLFVHYDDKVIKLIGNNGKQQIQ